MLTEIQKKLVLFIHNRIEQTGVPPSFDEMRLGLGMQSKSGIHRLIEALVERGFIRRLPNRARAIEVLRLPQSATVASLHPEPSDGKQSGARGKGNSNFVEIPVMGKIAAGVPSTAIETALRSIVVSKDMLASGEHFALEVKGESMIEAGILDGDTVILRKQAFANTGDIVVALIDGMEATLKRIRMRTGAIALEAANSAFETRILPVSRVAIQGKMVALIRHY